MKKNIIYLQIVIFSFLFTSCLKSGLKDIPTYNDAEISNFQFEYRWMEIVNGNNQLKVQTLNTTSIVNATNDTPVITAKRSPFCANVFLPISAPFSLSDIL